ncbi:ParB/RepB/Spo0J family partition protein [Parvularcula sp. ZS-1/3]|uniref:ParB/RepB/Spo0J family partition protein n=1 Tax=Parvularcula mediterranea TaxID=2732508 RepID=A0A7Y3RNK1_9PROT|nr:ParB/RepB/Spo0J family partition protein [Parvularcula mediterranea]NNU17374.1 ParB/RepB/Spo0J family partition protein [Parvularcula mediterranea]
MARKRARILADAINARLENTEKPEAPRREYTAERESLISEASDGRLKNGKLRLVDPKECRMWEGHNRLYDLLTPESCSDLIKSIKAVGRQEMPAIVRPVQGESYQYEVICGARRHFAISHLREAEHRTDILYLVDIRDITDEEAFRLSDLENREREDISDFERSRDYGRALTAYYDDNKALMAERIGVERTWLSRYLRIGELPAAILDAYGDVRGIGIRHAAELSPLLASDARSAVLAEASRIAEEGGERSPAKVLAALKGAAKAPKEKDVQTFFDGEGRTLLSSETRARTKVLTIPRAKLKDREALLKAIEEALF